jgi:hypothetical protein
VLHLRSIYYALEPALQHARLRFVTAMRMISTPCRISPMVTRVETVRQPSYSLIGTAKLNGLNPEAYLRHILERIADYAINKLDELLPWNVIAQVPSLRIAA